MSSDSIASLVVDLQLQVADLRKGVDEAKKYLAELEEPIHKIHEGLESLFEFENFKMFFEATAQLGEFVMKGAEAADQMGKMAQAAGVSVEEFSRLSYAANLSHVSTDDLGAAFKHLNVNLTEAATGSTKQTALFHALGISVKDTAGNTRNASDVMKDVAERFSELQDGASKSALAVDLFGKSGAAMIPLLNEGKEGLAEMGAESDKLGTTIDSHTAKAAQSFNDNLERVKKAVEGVALQVVANLAPSLAELTTGLTQTDAAAKGFKGTAEVLTTFFKLLASAAIEVVSFFRQVGTQFALLGSDIVDLASGNFDAIARNSVAAQKDLDEISKETKAQMDAIWDPKSVQDFNANLQPVHESADKIAQKFKDGEKAIEAQKKAAQELAAFLKETLSLKIELDAENSKSRMELQKKFAGIDAGASQQRGAFGDVGKTQEALLAKATAGFANFNEALDRSVFFSKARDEKLNEAAELQREGGFKAAQAALDDAESFGEMAKTADDAVKGFQKIAEIAAQSKDTLKGAFSELGSAVLQAIPRLNQLVSAAQQGAQVGGVWGALIAVFVQLISQTKAFQDIIGVVDSDLDQLIGALEPLVTAIASIIKAFEPVTHAITNLVSGVLGPVAGLLDSLSGIFKVIGDVLGEAIGSSNQFAIVMDTLKPIFEILKLIGVLLKVLAPILQLIMLPLKLIGDLFGGLFDLLNPVFKEIDKAVSWLSNRLDEFATYISTLGERIENFVKHGHFNPNSDFVDNDPSKGLKPTHNSTASDRAESAASDGLVSDVRATGEAVTGLGDAADKTSKAFDKLSASFANVPEGFRTALRTYQATAPGSGGFTEGFLGAATFHVNVQGSVITMQDLAKFLEAQLNRSKFKRTGKGS